MQRNLRGVKYLGDVRGGFRPRSGFREMAAQLAVSRAVRSVKFGGLVQAESTPKYSFTLATAQVRAEGGAGLSPEALSRLASYRELAAA